MHSCWIRGVRVVSDGSPCGELIRTRIAISIDAGFDHAHFGRTSRSHQPPRSHLRVLHRVLSAGVDLFSLRSTLASKQTDYRDPEVTDPSTDSTCLASEVEYRAAVGLDTAGQMAPTPAALGEFAAGRVLYDPTIR